MPWHIGKHEDCTGFAVILDDDGSLAGCHETEAEAKAQMSALYANEPAAEQEPGGPDKCVCPDCGYEVDKERGVPCRSMECPECGAMLIAGGEMQEALTKDGHSRGDHLVQGEADDPSTWHLPVKTGGKPDRRLMGAAKAALTVGYRGNKYEGPDKAEALRKLRAMYKAEELEWSESAVEQARNLIEQALTLLSDIHEDDKPIEDAMAESTLTEASTGHVIGIEEKEVDGGRLTPLTLDIAVIEPGPGNAKDGHYYPREVLRRDAGVFKGAKMYASDHRENEKSVGTWVSTIKACPVGFTESGAPIARVVVHKDWFARDILSLQQAGLLNRMECSILGSGKAKRGKVGETEYNIVEAITSADSVDWVTKAGAGGKALALAESDVPTPQDGGTMGEKEEQVQEAETVTLREEENGEQPQEAPPEATEQQPEATTEEPEPAEAALPAESVSELLKESGLAEDAQRLLSVGAYNNEQAVQDAIAEFKRIIKKASGSGQPFAQGATQPAQTQQISEADRLKRYADIKRRHGLDYPLAEVN